MTSILTHIAINSFSWLVNIEAEKRIYAWVKHAHIASDNGWSPIRRYAIIWTNAVIFPISTQGTYFSEIWFKIKKISFKKMHLKMSSAEWRPCCLGLNVFMVVSLYDLSSIWDEGSELSMKLISSYFLL